MAVDFQLIADAAGFVSGVGQAKKATADAYDNLAKRTAEAKQGFSDLGSAALKWGGILSGLGAGVSFGAAIAEGAKYQDQLDKVAVRLSGVGGLQAIAPDVGKALADMSGAGLGSITKLATALNEIPPSVVPAAQSLAFLASSAKFAKAGGLDQAQGVEVLVGTIKAYGLAAGDAARVSDLFTKGASLGGQAIGAFSSSIQTVLPSAKLLHIPLEQTVAAMSSLTAQGFSSEAAAAKLTTGFRILADGTDKLRKHGVDLGDVMSKRGLQGVMEELNRASGGTAIGLEKLGIPGKQLVGLLGLLTPGAKGFAGELAALDGAAGATDARFAALQKTTTEMRQALVEKLDTALAQVGSEFLNSFIPALAGADTALGKLIKGNDLKAWASSFGQEIGNIASKVIEYKDALLFMAKVAAAAWVADKIVAVAGAVSSVGAAFKAAAVDQEIANLERAAAGLGPASLAGAGGLRGLATSAGGVQIAFVAAYAAGQLLADMFNRWGEEEGRQSKETVDLNNAKIKGMQELRQAAQDAGVSTQGLVSKYGDWTGVLAASIHGDAQAKAMVDAHAAAIRARGAAEDQAKMDAAALADRTREGAAADQVAADAAEAHRQEVEKLTAEWTKAAGGSDPKAIGMNAEAARAALANLPKGAEYTAEFSKRLLELGHNAELAGVKIGGDLGAAIDKERTKAEQAIEDNNNWRESQARLAEAMKHTDDMIAAMGKHDALIQGIQGDIDNLFTGGGDHTKLFTSIEQLGKNLDGLTGPLDLTTAAGQRVGAETLKLVEDFLQMGGDISTLPPKVLELAQAEAELTGQTLKTGDVLNDRLSAAIQSLDDKLGIGAKALLDYSINAQAVSIELDKIGGLSGPQASAAFAAMQPEIAKVIEEAQRLGQEAPENIRRAFATDSVMAWGDTAMGVLNAVAQGTQSVGGGLMSMLSGLGSMFLKNRAQGVGVMDTIAGIKQSVFGSGGLKGFFGGGYSGPEGGMYGPEQNSSTGTGFAGSKAYAGMSAGVGIAASMLAKYQESTNTAARSLAYAAKGASMGGQIAGPWGMAVGAVIGGIVGIVKKAPAWKYVSEEISKKWGFEVSQATSEAILQLKQQLGGEKGTDAAAAMAGMSANKLRETIGFDLILGEAIQQGKVTSDTFGKYAQGAIDQAKLIGQAGAVGELAQQHFGQSFALLTQQAETLGTTGTKAFGDLVRAAKATGQDIAQVTQFLQTALSDAATGIQGLTADLSKTSKADFGDIETLAATTFNALATMPGGAVAAIAAMGGSVDALAKKQRELKIAGDHSLDGMMRWQSIVSGHRQVFDSLSAITKVAHGLGIAQFIDAPSFQAIENQAVSLNAQLQKAGLNSGEALTQEKDLLQEVINSHQRDGHAIDAGTQALIDQAKAMGLVKVAGTDAAAAAKDSQNYLLTGLAHIFGKDGMMKSWIDDQAAAFQALGNQAQGAAQQAGSAWAGVANGPGAPSAGAPAGGGSGGPGPEVPHFALGGVMPYDGYAYLHKDELILPPPQSTPSTVQQRVDTRGAQGDIVINLVGSDGKTRTLTIMRDAARSGEFTMPMNALVDVGA